MRLDLVLTPKRRIAPATDRDAERLRAFRVGDLLPVVTRGKPRNGANHRRLFALLRLIAENHPRYNTVEAARLELKIRAGHYDEHITVDGEIVFVPKKLDYESVDEIEFRELFDRFVDIAATDLLPSLPPKRLKAYIDSVVAFT